MESVQTVIYVVMVITGDLARAAALLELITVTERQLMNRMLLDIAHFYTHPIATPPSQNTCYVQRYVYSVVSNTAASVVRL